MNNNILEFIVRMKDLMSSQLTKLATTGKNTFAKIDSNVKQTMANVKFMGNSVNELRNRLVAVNEVRFGTALKAEFREATLEAKRLEAQIARLEGRRSGGGAGGGRSMLSRAASFIGPLMLAGALMSFGKSSIKSAMDFGGVKTSFGVLTGNKSTGDDLANNLRQIKQDTIMGPTVYKNAQTMLGFGIAANKVIPDLKMLGDISMGDADKLKRLTLAFSEVEAAGKLNGRRMLQFVNSGFNPLLEISRTTGKSMEQVAEMMKKGEISAGMLEGALKSATSTGGRFNNMLNVMAETPLGKMKKMEGQWAAFKIDAGEALIPLASWFMDAASSAMKFFNIHKSIPETLRAEQGEVVSLLGVITHLNQGNDLRRSLLVDLIRRYPDLFKNIDAEKTSNIELLKVLDDINGAYNKRIGLATSDMVIDANKKSLADAQKEYELYTTIAELQKRGDPQSLETAHNMLPFWRRQGVNISDIFGHGENDTQQEIMWAQTKAMKAKDVMDALQQNLINEGKLKGYKENYYMLQQALDITKDGSIDKLFKTKEGKDVFLAEIPHIAALKSIVDDMDFLNYGKFAKYDFEKLKKLLPSSVTAAGIVPKTTDEGTKASGKEVASSMTSGGPRIININGVKFTDKIEIHTGNITEGMNELERRFEDMFLRILNSGASVQ